MSARSWRVVCTVLAKDGSVSMMGKTTIGEEEEEEAPSISLGKFRRYKDRGF
jgi:hypothetical protein